MAAFVSEFLLGLRLFLPPLTHVAFFDSTVYVSLVLKGIKRCDGSRLVFDCHGVSLVLSSHPNITFVQLVWWCS